MQRAARPVLPRTPPDWEVACLHDFAFHLEAITDQGTLLDLCDRKLPDVGASAEARDVPASEIRGIQLGKESEAQRRQHEDDRQRAQAITPKQIKQAPDRQ